VACEHCGAALYLDLRGAALHTMVTPSIPHGEVAPRLRRALVTRDVLDEIEMASLDTVLVPYFGRGDVRTSRLCCALALPESAPKELRGLQGELIFYDATQLRETIPIEPELGPNEACGEPAEENARAQLVHVPFHRIRYRCQGRFFEGFVDAMTGQIHAEDWPAAPPRERNRELWLVASAWGIAYVACVACLPSWPWIFVGLLLISGGGYKLALWRLRSRGW
jgi:hypothetical protein